MSTLAWSSRAPAHSDTASQPAASALPATNAQLAEARKHFDLGVVHFDRQEWQAALVEFLKSRELVATRANTKNAAICLRKVGRYDESLTLFEALLRDFPDLPETDRELGRREIAELFASVGTLAIADAPPGARVSIDGVPRGTAPLADPLRLSAGTHVVRVEKVGSLPFEVRVDLAGREAKIVRVRLAALTHAGRLLVTEKHGRAAEVFVDGVRVGVAPWNGALAPGVHAVSLRGEDSFGTPPTRVEVVLERDVRLELIAVPLRAELRVRATPGTAAIVVDDVPAAHGSWTGRLTSGTHRIVVRKDGYAPFARTVSLSENAREELAVALEPLVTEARVLFELEAGVPLGLLWGGDLESSCTGPCAASLARGFYAQAHATYRVASGVGLGVFAGYLRMWRRLEGRAESVKPVNLEENPGTVDDHLRLAGLVFGGEAEYAVGTRWPFRMRVGIGALVGALTDTRTGTFIDSTGSSYPVATAQYPRASYLFVAPELRFGRKLGSAFEVSVGTKLLVLAALAQPAWDPNVHVATGADGQGSFAAADMTGGLMLALLPGASLAYEF